eukprot:2103396-Rhodomonas_salina.1
MPACRCMSQEPDLSANKCLEHTLLKRSVACMNELLAMSQFRTWSRAKGSNTECTFTLANQYWMSCQASDQA